MMRRISSFFGSGFLRRIQRTTRHFASRSVAGAMVCALLLVPCAFVIAQAAESAALEVESQIPLGDVKGRIDHLAFDPTRQRLFVAELGNDSVGVVDVQGRKVLRTLTGLHEPQGIGYVPSSDSVYVANAADGSVRVLRGEDLAPIGQIALGEDADNVRVDDAAHRVFVGYGGGALAVIDTVSHAKLAVIPLKAHPESFRLEPSGSHIFVNVPEAAEIAVVDRTAARQTASWQTDGLRANYPLALGEKSGQVLVVFRHPAKLGVFQAQDGHLLAALDTCGDSDDFFVDSKRHRLYVSCGEGYVDTFEQVAGAYRRVAHMATSRGARTSLFVPELDRLFLAVRATAATPASIWVMRPQP